jgi:hypothetical protein
MSTETYEWVVVDKLGRGSWKYESCRAYKILRIYKHIDIVLFW